MTLNIIGIGLNDEQDITIKGLEIVKNCDKVFLESYTSILQTSIEKLEELYEQKIIIANRELVEKNSDEILNPAIEGEVALLIIGDPFSATTHQDIFTRAKEKNIEVNIIHNASVLTAIGEVGLQLYKFGKTTSMPFWTDNYKPKTAYEVVKQNKKIGMHTLILLDLDPIKNKFLTIKEALKILQEIEKETKNTIVSEKSLAIGCARLGSEDRIIKTGSVKELKEYNFGKAPYCLIFPGKLHFSEEESLEQWK